MLLVPVFAIAFAQSPLRLPALFSDHMIVQRQKPINVFGWDAPGTKVQISLAGKKVTAIADDKGYFKGAIPALKEGGPYALTVEGTSTRMVNDVLVGEVWICSGQSNMEWPAVATTDIAQARTETDPNIRMFTVTKKVAQYPEKDVVGSWVLSAPNAIDGFSAVGFAYAKTLYKELHVPVGMIHTSWGGTLAEAWTSLDMLASTPTTKPISDRALAGLKSYESGLGAYKNAMDAWQRKAFPAFFSLGNVDWAQPSTDDSSWTTVAMPHLFADNFDGSVWYRLTLNLTADQAKAKTLELGGIDDLDQTYVNGKLVGSTDMSTPNFYSAPRNYTVPAGLLQEGKNVIAVRAYDQGGVGGFAGPSAVFRLGNLSISNGWKMKVEAAQVGDDPRNTPGMPAAPVGPNDPNFPSTLYNGMVFPLAPYSIRGSIWYQGESNAGRAVQYQTLLPVMIKNWRQLFAQGDTPFYIVQLANFMAPNPNQFDSEWAELRDAQDIVGQQKNCGTATIIDIGEAGDIHPRNKRDVGERLARIALAKDYRKRIEWQGPRLKKATFAAGQAVVELTHAAGLSTVDAKAPRCFAIAGEDKKWVWANATIEGGKIILSHPSVTKPIAVRYAWQDNPPVNLVNEDKLPAMPFRTDNWPMITANRL